MPRFALSVAFWCVLALVPVYAQSYFIPDPADSPQFTALVMGTPVRIPAGDGGGLLGIGKIAPLSFALTPVKDTPYLSGSFDVPSNVANWPAASVYVIAEAKTRRVLALFYHGREAMQLFERNGLALLGSAGKQRWEEAGKDPQTFELNATSSDRVFVVRRSVEDSMLMRAAPGFDRLEKFSIFPGVRLSFEIDAGSYAALGAAVPVMPPPLQVETNDLPQMLAFIEGKPFPIPAAMGGGVVAIGKPAPSSLPLVRVADSTWCRGTIIMVPPDEASPPAGFYFFARDPQGPIEVMLTAGLKAILMYESDRTATPEPIAVGMAIESSKEEPAQRRTLLATRFPHLVVAKGEFFEGYYRLSPGLRVVEDLPIGDTTRVKLDLTANPRAWVAAQEPLIARAWSAALGPDWSTLDRVRREALVTLGDETQAEKFVTSPGARLWSTITASASESKGPGRALLKRFGEAALKEAFTLAAFREIYEFSEAYPDTRPAGLLTEKLLVKYDAMSIAQLLSRGTFDAKQPHALTALRHARRVDAPDATDKDLGSFRFYIVHVMPEAEAETLVAKHESIWSRQLAMKPDHALWSRVAQAALKSFPGEAAEVKGLIEHLSAPKTTALRTTVAKLLGPLSDESLGRSQNGDFKSQPGMALATFVFVAEKPSLSPYEAASILAVLLFKLSHHPIYGPFQEAVVRDLPPSHVASLVEESVRRKEHSRLRDAFAVRLGEWEREAAQRGHFALAATLAVNQAEARGLPAPTDRITVLQLPKTAPEDPWGRARFYVGKLIGAAYPPLEPELEESEKLHRLLTNAFDFAFAPAFRDLGFTLGTVKEYALATRVAQGGDSKVVRLALSPPRFVPAAEAGKTPWTGREHPLLESRWRDLEVARRDVSRIGQPDAFASRFYGTGSLEEELRDVRARLGKASGTAQSYQGNVDAAARGLANYEREKATLERDGIAVGRDPNRPDRVVTRDLSSFENRSIATTIDNQKETLRREAAFQNRLNGEVAELEARERALVAQIAEYRGKANNTSFEYRNSAQRSLREAEEAYRKAQSEIGSLPDQGAAEIRNRLRFEALLAYRNALWTDRSGSRSEQNAELFWRRWWLSHDVGTAPEDRGGGSYTKRVVRPDAVEPVWRFEFDRAIAVEDRDLAVVHFLNGTRAIETALPAKPELLAELKTAAQRLRAREFYLPNRVLLRASGDTFKLLEPLLR